MTRGNVTSPPLHPEIGITPRQDHSTAKKCARLLARRRRRPKG